MDFEVPLKILFVSPEVVPFAKTGGLADVAGSLPKALKRLGCDVRLVMPLYRSVRQGGFPLEKLMDVLPISLGSEEIPASVYQGELEEGLPIYFIERDEFYDRSQLYGSHQGDYFDNDSRFVYFSKGVLKVAQALGFRPDIIHGHDWQSGLVPTALHYRRSADHFFQDTASIFTIHNMAYQGSFPPRIVELAGLPWDCFTPSGLEFWGKANLLKAGIVYSQVVNTVSRKYSQEIQTAEFGYGLEGILHHRRDDLFGILNGVDYELWNPQADPFLAASYTREDLSGKKACKKDLLSLFRLSEDRQAYPLLGIISRLADQKGFDLLAEVIDRLMEQEVTLVVLGTGEEKYHHFFTEKSQKFPQKIGLSLSYDDRLAHKIEAGSDLFLMPSQYEPCGLNQIYSLKYGTIPVVRATGGLDDTITPYDPSTGEGTGFKFVPYQGDELWMALQKAFLVYGDKAHWLRLVQNAMDQDFSWTVSAREYLKLYYLAMERLKK
jgi:starch synthase